MFIWIKWFQIWQFFSMKKKKLIDSRLALLGRPASAITAYIRSSLIRSIVNRSMFVTLIIVRSMIGKHKNMNLFISNVLKKFILNLNSDTRKGKSKKVLVYHYINLFLCYCFKISNNIMKTKGYLVYIFRGQCICLLIYHLLSEF